MDTYPILIIDNPRVSALDAAKDHAVRTGSESSISPRTSDEFYPSEKGSHTESSICDICRCSLASRFLTRSPHTNSSDTPVPSANDIDEKLRSLYIEDERLLHGTPEELPIKKPSESGRSYLPKKGVHFDSDTKPSDTADHACTRKAGGAHAPHPRPETEMNAFRWHIAQNLPRPGRHALPLRNARTKILSSRSPTPAPEKGDSVSSATTVTEAESSTKADMTVMFNKAMFSKMEIINRQRDMYAVTRGEAHNKNHKRGDKTAYRARRDAVASPLRWSQD
jgi:hypothetical protein